MRLLLDMGISVHLVAELRAAGHEVAHLADLSLETMEDSEILTKARTGGRGCRGRGCHVLLEPVWARLIQRSRLVE